ncbi:MAG: tetratricopeptide repeat protein [Myxococcales bacterium]|nr:tetratricopeptide repeat protein [Myxococcales bacterium]
MAEPEDDDLDLQPADAGALFRAEMWATNTVLGYWRHMLAVVVTGLLIFLFYGQYITYVQRTQRGMTAEIAKLESELPTSVEVLARAKSFGIDAGEDGELEKVADDLVTHAEGCWGASRAEALLKAAEIYRTLDNTEKRRNALSQAVDGAEGVMAFAAQGALANLELELGEHDEAVTRLRDLKRSQDGFLAQQAALDLGLALEQIGRSDEAVQVYDEFLSEWPESPKLSEVQERRKRVSG